MSYLDYPTNCSLSLPHDRHLNFVYYRTPVRYVSVCTLINSKIYWGNESGVITLDKRGFGDASLLEVTSTGKVTIVSQDRGFVISMVKQSYRRKRR